MKEGLTSRGICHLHVKREPIESNMSFQERQNEFRRLRLPFVCLSGLSSMYCTFLCSSNGGESPLSCSRTGGDVVTGYKTTVKKMKHQ